jgi:hypothetical protein
MFAFAILGVSLALGLTIGFGSSGFPPRSLDWVPPTIIFGGIGSSLVWVWMASVLPRPLADFLVSDTGIVVHDTRGRETRYPWSDPRLRIRLSHHVANESSTPSSPPPDRRIVLRVPRVSGEVPMSCSSYLAEAARRAGLSVSDRKKLLVVRGGAYWAVETTIRPMAASP